MKTFFTCLTRFIVATCILVVPVRSIGQITMTICNDPTNIIYGLTQAGTIYPINVNTAAVGTVVKNSTYSNPQPVASNALAYNPANGLFYYFKRNILSGGGNTQFVSFNPSTNTVTVLANSGFLSETHTGCVSVTGTGYYCVDIEGKLGYYNISANSWTLITNNIVDNYGASVSAVIQTQLAGDLAIDGWGNLWIVTSSDPNYGVYRLQAPLPTTAQGSVTVRRIVAPTASTPSGTMIAGIAFNPTGQILISTKTDNRLYVLENNLTLTYKGTFGVGDVGNDLTSCNFPLYVLPVIWKDFDVTLKGNDQVQISWTVMEDNNKGFYIQYSEDGTTWNDLSFIPGRNNPGREESFSYLHINESSGRVFYRIRQVDIGGQETFSKVGTVVLKRTVPSIVVWPNPTTSNINIDNAKRNDLLTEMELIEISGKRLKSQKLEPGLNTMSVADLPSGIYILKLLGPNQNYSQKIVKQ